MASTSGFPFAPAYLNLLRSGPPTVEPSSSKRKSKVKKATFISASVGRKLATKKAKAAKMKIIESATVTPVVRSPPLEPTVADTLKVNCTMPNQNDVCTKSMATPLQLEHLVNRRFYSCTSPSVIRFNYCCYSLIVAISKGEMKAFSGFAFLSLLKGQININGHNLKTGVRTEVINPSWQPAAMLVAECSSTSSSKKASFLSSIESTLDSFGLSAEVNMSDPEFVKWLSDSDCLVLVEGIPIDSQEWLTAAEDQSLYQEYSSPSYLAYGRQISANIDSFSPKCWWTDVRSPGKENIFGVVSAIIGEPYDVSRKTDIELLEYLPSWISSVDDMITDTCLPNCVASRTVICGAKGVGKSTCLRYTVNRLLSMTEAVAVIDCDLGQSEFTVPGMLSLHVIMGPILSPTHMHLSEPLSSYFIGDLTSRNEPEHFARALCALVEKYAKLQDKLMKEELKKRKENSISGNAFSLLSEKKMKMKMTPMPLVVNTDGSVRYMGAEVLIAVMKLVNPTHVLHISSEKDRDLPALDSIRGPPADCSSQKVNSTTSMSTGNNNSKKATLSSSDSAFLSSDSDRVSRGPTGCRLFTLDPGRLRPSKIHSVDLRYLRIISYFLRNITNLRIKVRKETPVEERIVRTAADDTYMPKPDYVTISTSESTVQLSSNLNVDSLRDERTFLKEQKPIKKMSKKAIALAAGEGIFVRRGSLVDPLGSLALAVMELNPLRVSMTEVIFQVQSTGLPPRLILAAMNASIVGIVCHATAKNGEECPFTKKIRLSRKPSSVVTDSDRMQIDDDDNRSSSTPTIDLDKKVEEEEEEEVEDVVETHVESANSFEFEINYTICDDATSERELPMCIGIGIVRAIDLENQLLYILTPIDPSRLNGLAGRVGLVRGQLQLPGIMTYAPDVMSEHPYISSEVTGEGSNVMKTRNNMKRRSQQN